MVAPHEKGLTGFEAAVQLGDSVEQAFSIADRWDLLPRQAPLHCAGEVHRKEDRRHRRVEMGVDETGHDHVVPERVVDFVREPLQPRAHGLERADLQNPPVPNGDRRCRRQRGLHGANPLGEEDRDLGHRVGEGSQADRTHQSAPGMWRTPQRPLGNRGGLSRTRRTMTG